MSVYICIYLILYFIISSLALTSEVFSSNQEIFPNVDHNSQIKISKNNKLVRNQNISKNFKNYKRRFNYRVQYI